MHRAATRICTLLALVLGLSVLLIAASPAPADATTTPRSMELDFLALVNMERAKVGLGALTEQSDIRSVARAHSGRMASGNSLHHNPDFSIEITGWQRVSENVGYGPRVEAIHRALMNSEGHRRNILDERVTQAGIGVVVDDNGRVWVTQNFRQPAGGGSHAELSSKVFGDVASSNVHAGSIEQVVADGIMETCSPSRFCPNDDVTRGDFASMLVRALDLDAPSSPDSRFRDTSGEAAQAAETLAEAGLTMGCTTRDFCPDRSLTREQMATFFARALELEPVPAPFSDVGATHSGSVGALARADIVNGCAVNRFCPGDHVTRAQTASMLARHLG